MAKIKIKRGLEANIGSIILDDGEFAVTTDTHKLYVGLGGQNICIASASGLGDMLKSVYDVDNDGVVEMIPVADASKVGGIKVGSNLSVTPDGVLSGNSNPQSYIHKQESFTISNGQTTFTLTKGYYNPGTNSLSWSIYGVQQLQEALTENSSTSFSIPSGLTDGTQIDVEYIQAVNLEPYPPHKTEHLPGGTDDLGLKAVALSGSYNDLSDKPLNLPANGGNADTVDNKHASDFATAAQGTKADNALPSANYTASDVLSKLKTVDGSGCGVDADTVDGVHSSTIVQNGAVMMNTNPFGGRQLYINSMDNAMWNAAKKWFVTVTTHLRTYNGETYPKLNPDWLSEYTVSGSGTSFIVTGSPTNILVYVDTTLYTQVTTPDTGNNYSYSSGVITFGKTISGTVHAYPDSSVPQYLDSPIVSTLDGTGLFDGSYEGGLNVATGYYMKVHITFDSTGTASAPTYPYGYYFLSYYYTSTPEKSEVRTFNRNYQLHGIGWKINNFSDFVGTNAGSNYIQSFSDEGNYGRSIIDFIIYAHGSHTTTLTEIDWKLDRPSLNISGATVTKYGSNKLYNDLTLGDQTTNKTIISASGAITGTQLTSTVATGTAPIAVSSTTKVINLNADKLDDQEGSYYLSRSNHTGTQTASTISDFASTVLATVLTGLSTATNAVITATDSILIALGKLQKQISDHLSNISNPHSVTKVQVGLGNVDNTSDVNKPVSTAQQTALDLKANLASPIFTGTPKAPTASSSDNSTQVATTAFVKAQGYITSAGSGAKITVDSAAPSSPSPGDFWFEVIS